METTENDVFEHILTTCDGTAPPTLVTLLKKYWACERINAYDTYVHKTLVLASKNINGVKGPILSDELLK